MSEPSGTAETGLLDRETLQREIIRRYHHGRGPGTNETGLTATVRIALDVVEEHLVTRAARQSDYCPTCGAEGPDGFCATRTGRDHPRRNHWRTAFMAGFRTGRSISSPPGVPTSGGGDS